MEAETSPAERLKVGERRRALVVVVILLAVTLWPVFRSPPRDSFPHSTYPMFSHNREPVADIELVVGVDGDGRTVTLSSDLIAGTEEVIVAGSLIRAAIRSGPKALARLCRAAADRVADQGYDEVTEVAVRTARHDAVAWFAGDREPISITTHATCPVQR